MHYDRQGDTHYDVISALIKSIRGSDPDAGLYWLAHMLEGGEDIRFLARRLVILASEDVGNADPAALPLAVAAAQACELVGLPECQLALAQAVTYLACAEVERVDGGHRRGPPRRPRGPAAAGADPPPRFAQRRRRQAARPRRRPTSTRHDQPDAIAAQDYLGVEREYYRPTDGASSGNWPSGSRRFAPGSAKAAKVDAGDWSIFRRQDAVHRKIHDRKHGPVPFRPPTPLIADRRIPRGPSTSG